VQVLAYADDLDITGRSERDVKEAFIKLNNEAQKIGLNIYVGASNSHSPTRWQLLLSAVIQFQNHL
jgi:hypothetical protein